MGYFEEKAVRNKWTKLELEFLIDNKGKASTTITKIVADVPAEGGGIMSAEGKIFLEGKKVSTVPIGGNQSTRFNATFIFDVDTPKFSWDFIPPVALDMGLSSKSLPVKVVISHTHGRLTRSFQAFPRGSMETELKRRLFISDFS